MMVIADNFANETIDVSGKWLTREQQRDLEGKVESYFFLEQTLGLGWTRNQLGVSEARWSRQSEQVHRQTIPPGSRICSNSVTQRRNLGLAVLMLQNVLSSKGCPQHSIVPTNLRSLLYPKILVECLQRTE